MAYKQAYDQRQSSNMQQGRHHRQPRQSGLLKSILSKQFETGKIQLDTANGACVKTAVGHKPVHKR